MILSCRKFTSTELHDHVDDLRPCHAIVVVVSVSRRLSNEELLIKGCCALTTPTPLFAGVVNHQRDVGWFVSQLNVFFTDFC